LIQAHFGYKFMHLDFPAAENKLISESGINKFLLRNLLFVRDLWEQLINLLRSINNFLFWLQLDVENKT